MKPGKPFRLPAASSPEATRVTIGLDFGTSGTKVVVNFEDAYAEADRFFAVPVDDVDGNMSLITPSTLAIRKGNVLIGHQAEKDGSGPVIRSFKMCVPCLGGAKSGSEKCRRCTTGHPGHFQLGTRLVDVVDVSTLYLAIVLFRARLALKQHLGRKSLKLRVNSAAPLDQLNDHRLKPVGLKNN